MSPLSGSGTMTPITSGAGVGTDLAQPLPYTLLSLSRYARVMGITPLHFFRGATPGLVPIVFPDAGCDDIWFKYDWQGSDKVSWTQLAYTIQDVELEIANLIGYWPAPMWLEEEYHPYPRPHRREYHGTGVGVRDIKSIKLDYGKIIGLGRRAVTLVGTATVGGGSLVYTDEDSDGFFETATITLPTALTDATEIKVYFSNHDGDLLWEVRDPYRKALVGGNIVFTYHSWQLIDPELYEDFPTDDGVYAIDVSTTANFVTTVDIYREYIDTTQASAQFKWEDTCSICGGVNTCAICTPLTQDGCSVSRDDHLGIVVPSPGSYSAADGLWVGAAWSNGHEPDSIKMWYRAGALNRDYVAGRIPDPLPNDWANIIAWMATARLERPLCNCSNVQAVSESLREDLAVTTSETSRFVSSQIYNCPFGTRRGEVKAWNRIRHFVRDKIPNVALA